MLDRHIRPQLESDIGEAMGIDANGWLEDDYYWFDQAYDLKKMIISSNGTLPLDAVMDVMEHWYKPDTVVRDELSDIITPTLDEFYKEYWLHPKCPWTPIGV